MAATNVYDDKAREKLLAKMNRALARLNAEKARKAGNAAAGADATGTAASVGGIGTEEAGGESAAKEKTIWIPA